MITAGDSAAFGDSAGAVVGAEDCVSAVGERFAVHQAIPPPVTKANPQTPAMTAVVETRRTSCPSFIIQILLRDRALDTVRSYSRSATFVFAEILELGTAKLKQSWHL